MSALDEYFASGHPTGETIEGSENGLDWVRLDAGMMLHHGCKYLRLLSDGIPFLFREVPDGRSWRPYSFFSPWTVPGEGNGAWGVVKRGRTTIETSADGVYWILKEEGKEIAPGAKFVRYLTCGTPHSWFFLEKSSASEVRDWAEFVVPDTKSPDDDEMHRAQQLEYRRFLNAYVPGNERDSDVFEMMERRGLSTDAGGHIESGKAEAHLFRRRTAESASEQDSRIRSSLVGGPFPTPKGK